MSKVIEGGVALNKQHLSKLPNLQDVTVNGYFYCHKNHLTTLEGCPVIINDSFDCSFNELTTLDHCPKTVTGVFMCYKNKVQFTEEQVRAVCSVGGMVLC